MNEITIDFEPVVRFFSHYAHLNTFTDWLHYIIVPFCILSWCIGLYINRKETKLLLNDKKLLGDQPVLTDSEKFNLLGQLLLSPILLLILIILVIPVLLIVASKFVLIKFVDLTLIGCKPKN